MLVGHGKQAGGLLGPLFQELDGGLVRQAAAVPVQRRSKDRVVRGCACKQRHAGAKLQGIHGTENLLELSPRDVVDQGGALAKARAKKWMIQVGDRFVT